MSATTTQWTLLGEWNGFEYWRAERGSQDDVYRRRVSADNYLDRVTGAPMAARYDGSYGHFLTFVAGRLPV